MTEGFSGTVGLVWCRVLYGREKIDNQHAVKLIPASLHAYHRPIYTDDAVRYRQKPKCRETQVRPTWLVSVMLLDRDDAPKCNVPSRIINTR